MYEPLRHGISGVKSTFVFQLCAAGCPGWSRFGWAVGSGPVDFRGFGGWPILAQLIFARVGLSISNPVRTEPFNPANARSHPIFPHSMLKRLVNSTAMLSSRMKSLQTAITAFLCDLCVLGGKSISGFRSFALSYKQPTKSNLITPLFSAATCHCSSPFVTLRAVSPLLATYEKPPRVHPFPPTQT
jgi:hypothetical protein